MRWTGRWRGAGNKRAAGYSEDERSIKPIDPPVIEPEEPSWQDNRISLTPDLDRCPPLLRRTRNGALTSSPPSLPPATLRNVKNNTWAAGYTLTRLGSLVN